MKNFIFLATIITCLISCGKIDLNNHFPQYVGDYEWVYSGGAQEEPIGYEHVSDRYGLRINDKSKIYMFKNGEKVMKEVAIGATSNSITLSPNQLGISNCYLQEDVMVIPNYPLSGQDNYYVRVN